MSDSIVIPIAGQALQRLLSQTEQKVRRMRLNRRSSRLGWMDPAWSTGIMQSV